MVRYVGSFALHVSCSSAYQTSFVVSGLLACDVGSSAPPTRLFSPSLLWWEEGINFNFRHEPKHSHTHISTHMVRRRSLLSGKRSAGALRKEPPLSFSRRNTKC
eukprot:scaffold3418_cov124-Isochrysis_galbana.AAC.38